MSSLHLRSKELKWNSRSCPVDFLGLLGRKAACPLKDMGSDKKAREAAKWIMEQHVNHPEKEWDELIAEAIAKFG